MCDRKAREIRENIEERREDYNIQYFRDNAMLFREEVIIQSTNEMIRIIVVIEEENRYLRETFPDKYEVIDIHARENIRGIRKIAAAFKCYYGINQYGERDRKINKDAKLLECPCCSKVETWEHIVQYSKMIHLRIEFIVKMYKELKANQLEDILNEEVRMVVEDIRRFFRNKDEEIESN